jgi:m7GpppX diphosphatase
MYEAVTKHHIESIPAGSIQWVYNILEKKEEVDRLLFEDDCKDTGFMLHPDQKWDQSQVCSVAFICVAWHDTGLTRNR